MAGTLRAASITFVLIAATGAVHAQAGSEAEVKTAVRAAWDAYIDAFSDARTEVLAKDVYAAPSFQIGAGGANVRLTVADTKAAFDATHRALARERYGRSETDTAEICVLNDGAALLTAHFTRYRTDNSVMMNGASAYLFAKFGDDWRILAIIGNPAAKLIACDQ